ncbi:hypothetical protein [Streptomyces sp. NRRL B-1347]|uniref:hypothetical protein n=1 Tax=Streptomyces sp. NRRL B-1347 TaxID=1476877 RepID=UPI0004CB017D|nr:hypothetical protein [Streptomyces sp. NRRL B-1347]
MQTAFVAVFIIAVVVQTVLVVAFVREMWSHSRHGGPEPTVFTGSDVIVSGLLVGGAMTVLALATHHWNTFGWHELIVFSAVFGFSTAGLLTLMRRKRWNMARQVALLIPIGLGALAGMSGVTL